MEPAGSASERATFERIFKESVPPGGRARGVFLSIGKNYVFSCMFFYFFSLLILI